jgi:hypothetical protein
MTPIQHKILVCEFCGKDFTAPAISRAKACPGYCRHERHKANMVKRAPRYRIHKKAQKDYNPTPRFNVTDIMKFVVFSAYNDTEVKRLYELSRECGKGGKDTRN